MRVGLVIALLAISLFGPPRVSGDKKDQEGQTEPHSPRELLRQLQRAIRHEDKKAYLECFWDKDEQMRQIIEASFDAGISALKFRQALIDSYGADAWEKYANAQVKMGFNVGVPSLEPEWVDKVRIRQEADGRAWVTLTKYARPSLMIKRDRVWRFGTKQALPPKAKPEKIAEFMRVMLGILNEGRKFAKEAALTIPALKAKLGQRFFEEIRKLAREAREKAQKGKEIEPDSK